MNPLGGGILSAFIAILCSSILVEGYDYCGMASCNGLNHIGCNNDGRVHPQCASYSKFYDLSYLKKDILHYHNNYRNQIAKGNVSTYKKAERMATMLWDDELAYLAGLNVKTCKFNHDQCRNTKKYELSGQNLFWSATIGEGIKDSGPEAEAKDAVDSWFSEYKDANMRTINKFGSAPSSKTVGHFTVMVSDINTRVGCAAIKNRHERKLETTIACNYASTNVVDYPIYVAGKTASKCVKGTNPKYPALCHPSEPIDPNNVYRK